MLQRIKENVPAHVLWPLLALVLLLVFNFIATENFFQIGIRDGHLYGTLIDIIDRAAPVLLISLGMTLVIATGGVDLSVGAVMAISGAVAAGIISQTGGELLTSLPFGGSVFFALLAAIIVAMIAGAVNGGLVAFAGIQPIIATLILMVMGRGIAQLLTDGQILTVQSEFFSFLGNGFFLGLPINFTIVAVMYLLSWILIRRTALGLFIEAIGDNPTASFYAGVNIRLIKWLIYVFSGFCSGLAGILAAADIQAADANNAGLYLELDAILAVVLGGTALAGGRFYLAGTIVGALLIQSVTTTILTRGIEVEYTLVVKAFVIIIVCLLQSSKFRSLITSRMRRAAA